ncbi:unnamed protein product [Heligmosomoides polygyrus]|uniref:Calsyntenin-1-like n=1 Tax=Heligmosomoides polygyrus TaxID=6339 RepID=A0A183F8V8_HELPZ|nr:unnamed protein product [Heligmosomoides polygyrus]
MTTCVSQDVEDSEIYGFLRPHYSSEQKGHVLLSLSVCLSRFHPPVPPELVRVHFVELAESKPNGNSAAVLPSLKQMDEDPGHDCDSTADSETDVS